MGGWFYTIKNLWGFGLVKSSALRGWIYQLKCIWKNHAIFGLMNMYVYSGSTNSYELPWERSSSSEPVGFPSRAVCIESKIHLDSICIVLLGNLNQRLSSINDLQAWASFYSIFAGFNFSYNPLIKKHVLRLVLLRAP